jgi:hypothetical protein
VSHFFLYFSKNTNFKSACSFSIFHNVNREENWKTSADCWKEEFQKTKVDSRELASLQLTWLKENVKESVSTTLNVQIYPNGYF